MQKQPGKFRLVLRDVFSTLRYVWYVIYKFEYAFGMYTLTALHRGFRYLKRELQPMFGWLHHFVFQRISTYLKSVFTRVKGVKTVFKEEFDAPRTTEKRSLLRTVKDWFSSLFSALGRYPAVLGRVLRVVLPTASCLLLFATIHFWNTATFGIRVEYDGVDVGIIQDEKIYREAAELARDRVYSEDGSFTISDTPVMNVTISHQDAMLDTTAMCNNILSTHGDAISEGCGLYVNKKFIGSMRSREELEDVLNDIKKAYLTGAKNERAEFIQKVELTDGLFLSDSVMTKKQMKKILTAEAVVKKEYTVKANDVMGTIARDLDMTLSKLRSLNPQVKNDIIYEGQKLVVQSPQPFLRVKVVRTVRYYETIDYSIEKEYDNTKYVTWEYVKVRGVEGKQKVTAEVTYVDGLEQSRTILTIKVTKQPVAKVVIVGTKPVYANGNQITQGDGKTTGSMTWPVPSCHNMSRGWQVGHYALDITNGPTPIYGAAIVAADGGTVIFSGWNTGGYGYLVQIQHANGLQTMYAHCSALNVVTGQKVTRGQVIARVGSSGWSTGPHLHFEVRQNGIRINPLNFVRP